MAASLSPQVVTVGGSAWLMLNANQSLTVVGNDSVSNVAAAGENVVSATIGTAIWGAGPANSYWKVARGSNTVLVLTGTGNTSVPAIQFNTGTIVANLVNGTDGFLMLKLSKNISSNTYAY
jgi:hypothetical protein